MTKYKRSSVVIFVVALILGISAVLLSYTGILYLILDVKTESGAAVNTRRPIAALPMAPGASAAVRCTLYAV